MISNAVALAPAKINIGLEVTAVRSDGMHEIVSIMQTITLYDRVRWTDSAQSFTYTSPVGIPDDNDLTRRALDWARDTEHWSGRLELQKSIPVAAGLGGGSSDAALALRIALQGMPPSRVTEAAAELGSDVPFFLEGGAALATGTGVELRQLPHIPAWCVVVTPRITIPDKTRTLYGLLTRQDFTDGSQVRAIAMNMGAGCVPTTAPPNAFIRPLMEYPHISIAYQALSVAGAPWVSVSGAGPSLYTLVPHYRAALSIARRVPPEVGETIVACTLPRQRTDTAAENLASRLRGATVLR